MQFFKETTTFARKLTFSRRGMVFGLLLLGTLLIVPLFQAPNNQINAQSGTASIKTLVWNTGTNRDLPEEAKTPDRGAVCHPAGLEKAENASKFYAQYMTENKIDLALLQEVSYVCDSVPLTKDEKGRDIVYFQDLEYPGTMYAIDTFKRWFKDNYKFKGKEGKSMTDEEFEKELIGVIGRKTYEDVWVQFLPFDVSFWTAMNLIFVHKYPMETITKPYEADTQGMRVVTYSRLPLSRPVNYAKGADMIPLPGRESDIGKDFKTNKDTRWVVRAPLDSPFGDIYVYNLHTRASASCIGVKESMLRSRTNYAADSIPYALGGDFNAVLLKNDCGSEIENWPLLFNLAHLGLKFKLHDGSPYMGKPFTTPIDYIVIPKKTNAGSDFPIEPDLNSGIILSAGIGHNDDFAPTPYPGRTPSDHDGLVFNIVGEKVQDVPGLTSLYLPDYGLHVDADKDEEVVLPPINVPPPASAACFDEFLTDFEAIRSKGNVEGMLLFSPFGDNPDPNFVKHKIPPSFVSKLCNGGSCTGTKVGINPGTIYGQAGKERPAQYGFDWFLQISEQSNPGATISTINSLPATTKAIIRIGIADSGIGFDSNPDTYVAFLNTVWAGLSEDKKQSTYVIAGPNEPDIEWKWFAPECAPGHGDGGKEDDATSQAFYNCVGPKLATYMNAIIAGNPGFKLLSPTFNMTSFTLQGIFGKMNSSGANWAGLTAISGNLYPNQVPMTTHWETNGIDSLLETAGGLPLVITETGPYDCELEDLITPDDYYIHPIKGINSGTGGDALNTVRDDLISQGYQVSCAGPSFKIGVTSTGLGAMKDLFEQPMPYPNGVVMGMPNDEVTGGGYGADRTVYQSPPIYSVLSVDYRDSMLPVFRDLDGNVPGMKQSIEEYFGFKSDNSWGGLYSGTEISSAAINSLVTNPQRCSLSYLNLLSRKAMCDKLADPSSCALYLTKAGDTGYDAQSLLPAFQDFYSQVKSSSLYPNADVMQACRLLLASKDSSKSALKDAMLQMPLTMDRAYRLAFVVTAIRLRLPNPLTYTNLFTHPLGGWLGPPHPKHAIIVTAFKVPDILTNKGAIDDGLKETNPSELPQYVTSLAQGSSGDISYMDPAILTRNSLITAGTAYDLERQQRCQREVFQEAAAIISSKVQDDTWAEIECLGGGNGGVTGVGSPQCKDPLSKALVDMINTQVLLSPVTKGIQDYCALNPKAIANLLESQISPKDGEEDEIDTDNLPIDPEEIEKAVATVEDEILLSQVLTGEEFACEGVSEDSSTIVDPAGLTPLDNPSHVFTDEWGKEMLAKLFAGDECTHKTADGEDPAYASTQDPGGCANTENWFLKSKFFVTPGMNATDQEADLSVKHFMIYPVGYDLRTVESVLAGSFFSSKQLEALATEALKKDRITINETTTTFQGGQQSFSFTERRPDKCLPEEKTGTNFVTGEEYTYIDYTCPNYTIGFQNTTKKPPQPQSVLGARLGFWMKSMQMALTSVRQGTHDYLTACKSVEEFLLDQCGVGVASTGFVGIDADRIPLDGLDSTPDASCSATLEEMKYDEASTLPMTGIATTYADGVMNTVLNNRLNGAAGRDMVGNTTIKNCELTQEQLFSDGEYDPYGANNPNPTLPNGQKYVGCVAMLRKGDLYFRTSWYEGTPAPNNLRSIWIKNTQGQTVGPFAVIDTATTRDAPCLYDGSRYGGETWAVDIDFKSYFRLYPAGAVRKATLCESEAECQSQPTPGN